MRDAISKGGVGDKINFYIRTRNDDLVAQLDRVLTTNQAVRGSTPFKITSRPKKLIISFGSFLFIQSLE